MTLLITHGVIQTSNKQIENLIMSKTGISYLLDIQLGSLQANTTQKD